MVAPSGVRLRESCEACSASKIKCPKEKPTCSRCAEKGATCQYLITQKTGRKARQRSIHDQQPSALDSHQNVGPAAEITPPSSISPPSLGSGDGTNNPLGLPLVTPQQLTDPSGATLDHTAQDCPPLITNPADLALAWSTQTFDQALSTTATLNSSFLSPGLYTNPSHDLLADFASSPSQFGQAWQLEGTRMALKLMEQVCGQEDSYLTASLLDPSEVDARTKNLLGEYRKVTDQITGMLSHADGEDGHFLVVVCLLVSKLLNGYAKVANDMGAASATSPEPPSQSRSARAAEDEAGSGRRRGSTGDPKGGSQLLDDLYQLRAVLDCLGDKIRVCNPDQAGAPGSDQDFGGPGPVPSSFLFSPAVLNQLHGDLRKYLAALSIQVLNGLKQFWVQ